MDFYAIIFIRKDKFSAEFVFSWHPGKTGTPEFKYREVFIMKKLNFLYRRIRQQTDLYLSASNPTVEWKAVILADIYHLAYDYIRLGGKRDLTIILRRLDK